MSYSRYGLRETALPPDGGRPLSTPYSYVLPGQQDYYSRDCYGKSLSDMNLYYRGYLSVTRLLDTTTAEFKGKHMHDTLVRRAYPGNAFATQ